MNTTCDRRETCRRWLSCIVFCVVVCGSRGTSANDDSTTFESVYDQARQAAVEILVDDKHAGSGWFASDDGLVLTAAHVLDRFDRRVELLSPVVGRRQAKPVAVDRGHDLLLLRATSTDKMFSPLKLAKRTPSVGSDVFLYGAPLYRSAVLLPGRMARSGTTYEFLPAGWHIRCTHVAALAPPGVSGGPWLNAAGEVVGLQSGAMTIGNAQQGVAYMVPVDAIRNLLERRQNAATPTLGAAVEETWQQDRAYLDRLPRGTEGLVVRRMATNGPAAKAGLEMWDLIRAVDGQPVRLREGLLQAVRRRKPGEKVRLTVLRYDGGETRKFVVELGKLEVNLLDK